MPIKKSAKKSIKKAVKKTAKKLPVISAATLARRFRDRNRRFLKLSVAQQRIKIIRDAISSIILEKTKAVTGSYITVKNYKPVIKGDDQVNEIAEKANCQVCGIGGVFISAVLLKNEFKVKNFDTHYGDDPNLKEGETGSGNIKKYLNKWFDTEQLELVEAAFEVSNSHASEPSRGATEAAITFGRKHRSLRGRLLAIYNNMLENNGKFVVPVSDTEAE